MRYERPEILKVGYHQSICKKKAFFGEFIPMPQISTLIQAKY